MDRNEFDNDKSIEPGQLDLEAVRQADLFFKWAQRSIEARSEVDRQKFALEVLEAKLENQIRDDPEKYGLVKVTESAIKAAVKIQKAYTDAFDRYLEARETAGILDAAREAMEQKKRMIEVLITLHGQQYFAGPSVPRDLVSAWKEAQEGAEERVNDRQRQKTRRRTH